MKDGYLAEALFIDRLYLGNRCICFRRCRPHDYDELCSFPDDRRIRNRTVTPLPISINHREAIGKTRRHNLTEIIRPVFFLHCAAACEIKTEIKIAARGACRVGKNRSTHREGCKEDDEK